MTKKNISYYTFEPSEANQGPVLTEGFFFYISSIQPQTTEFDYIETKKTRGGNQLGLSMLKIPLFHYFKCVCNANPATYDLTQIWNNAAKLNNRSIINTQNNALRGLLN